MKVWIFSTVFPEPQSSAAGRRLMEWINRFREMQYEVWVVSPAEQKGPSDWGYFSPQDGVTFRTATLNSDEVFLDQKTAPEIVIYDRFVTEEQWGDRVRTFFPNAITVIETQDLHSLRNFRLHRWKNKQDFQMDAYLKSDEFLREMTSFMRVDGVVVISQFEFQLLSPYSHVLPHLKCVPFQWIDSEKNRAQIRSIPQEKKWVWIGNFRHEPNIQGLRWFRENVWPKVRKENPDVFLHVYGSYPLKEVMEWNQKDPRFQVKGSVQDLTEVYENAWGSIAPVLTGAGLKGKVIESLEHGVSVLGSSLAFEGYPFSDRKNSAIFQADTIEDWVFGFQRMSQEDVFFQAQKDLQKLRDEYGLMSNENEKSLRQWVVGLKKRDDLIHRMLLQETTNSKRYFSKWLELKGKSSSD